MPHTMMGELRRTKMGLKAVSELIDRLIFMSSKDESIRNYLHDSVYNLSLEDRETIMTFEFSPGTDPEGGHYMRLAAEMGRTLGCEREEKTGGLIDSHTWRSPRLTVVFEFHHKAPAAADEPTVPETIEQGADGTIPEKKASRVGLTQKKTAKAPNPKED